MNTELRYIKKTIEINSILFSTLQAFTKYSKDSFREIFENNENTTQTEAGILQH